MQLVSTPADKEERKMTIDELINYKKELKDKIQSKKDTIKKSGNELFSWQTAVNYLIFNFQQKLTLTDGIVFGMKIIRILGKIFKKESCTVN